MLYPRTRAHLQNASKNFANAHEFMGTACSDRVIAHQCHIQKRHDMRERFVFVFAQFIFIHNVNFARIPFQLNTRMDRIVQSLVNDMQKCPCALCRGHWIVNVQLRLFNVQCRYDNNILFIRSHCNQTSPHVWMRHCRTVDAMQSLTFFILWILSIFYQMQSLHFDNVDL